MKDSLCRRIWKISGKSRFFPLLQRGILQVPMFWGRQVLGCSPFSFSKHYYLDDGKMQRRNAAGGVRLVSFPIAPESLTALP